MSQRAATRAGRADRVAVRNGAAFDIDDVIGKSEFTRNHDGDGRKRLR